MMTTHPRQAVIENVDKMVECGNPSFGSAMSFKLVRTTHRHCVFTIPEELRHFLSRKKLISTHTVLTDFMSMQSQISVTQIR